MAYGIFVLWPGIKPAPSSVKVQSPNWTVREFPWVGPFRAVLTVCYYDGLGSFKGCSTCVPSLETVIWRIWDVAYASGLKKIFFDHACHVACRILVPDQGSKLHPLSGSRDNHKCAQWKCVSFGHWKWDQTQNSSGKRRWWLSDEVSPTVSITHLWWSEREG